MNYTKYIFIFLGVAFVNPNSGGLVANVTFKTQNYYDKFLILKKF
jgi:hypothetical protein